MQAGDLEAATAAAASETGSRALQPCWFRFEERAAGGIPCSLLEAATGAQAAKPSWCDPTWRRPLRRPPSPKLQAPCCSAARMRHSVGGLAGQARARAGVAVAARWQAASLHSQSSSSSTIAEARRRSA